MQTISFGAMRADELHADVHELLGRLRIALGFRDVEIARRRAPRA